MKRKKQPMSKLPLKFYWSVVFGAFSVFFIVLAVLLLSDNESGEFATTDYYADGIDVPASDDISEEHWPEHSILTPAELRKIELFLELSPSERDAAHGDDDEPLARVSELPFTLVSADPRDDVYSSSAWFINQRSMKREYFHVGEELEPGVTLIYVTEDKAFIRHGPWTEYFVKAD